MDEFSVCSTGRLYFLRAVVPYHTDPASMQYTRISRSFSSGSQITTRGSRA
jgi:hypothetical protein